MRAIGKLPKSVLILEFIGMMLLAVAHISDHVFYANANKAATPLVSAEVRDNPGIYPPADVRAKLFTLKVQDPKIDRVRTRAWTKVKSGK
ncbi:TPA: DUF1418 family protein [Escherichia coli]